MTEAMPFLQKLITFLWPPDIKGGVLSFGIALANRTTSSAGEDKKALAPSNERSEPLTRFFSERKFQLKVGCPLTGCRASDASEENFSAS